MRYVVVNEGVTPMSKRLKAAFAALAAGIVIVGAEVFSTHMFGVHLTGAEYGPKVQISADQFAPGGEWKLKKEEIHPASLDCNGSSCPSVYRAWDVGTEPASEEEIKEMIKSAGYVEATNEGCKASGTTDFSKPILLDCQTTDADGKIKVTVKEMLPSINSTDPFNYTVSLYVTK